MKLSISVMAHEKRAKFFSYLNMRLGDVKFSIDKDGPENIGVWRNCKRSWLMYDRDADYHIVIQDDSIVCDNFQEKAKEFIEKMSDVKTKAFQFYFGNRRALKHFADQGFQKGYVEDGTMWWGVALCLPTKLIPEMIKYCDQLKMKQDDIRIRKFLKEKKIKTCYPIPSLIDHRHGEVSLVGDPGRGRKAFHYIDKEKDEYKWNGMGWPERTGIIAEMIPARSNVVDLGGGQENLKKYLSDCKYVSIDKVKLTPDTLVGDFNKGQYPEVGNSEHVGDYIVAQGILEYIEKPLVFLENIKKYGRKLILSYNFSGNGLKKNDLTLLDLEDVIKKSGWEIDTVNSNLMTTSNTIIYELRK